jgi:hypothetical protein
MRHLVKGFEVRHPEGKKAHELEVYCPNHPLWEPMRYDLLRDLYRCTGEEGLCGRQISATVLWEVLGSSA